MTLKLYQLRFNDSRFAYYRRSKNQKNQKAINSEKSYPRLFQVT